MNRDKWAFAYTADKLAAAARLKKSHHETRLAFWDGKKTEVISKIKAEGIEIDESLSDIVSNSYRAQTVNIRNDLLKDLQECIAKIYEHRAKVAEYEAWIEVLVSQGQSTLELHHDDWHFFFGK